jgi:hypothetical protein
MPGTDQQIEMLSRDSTSCVNCRVVRPELVDAIELHMGATLAHAAVSSLAFAAIQLVEVTVHAHQQHVEPVELMLRAGSARRRIR